VGADKTQYRDLRFVDMLDAFASSAPVPGGGSASAAAGAVGTSLLLMVSGMSKTRTGAAQEAADLAAAAARLRPLRDALATLVDRDSDAYAAVAAAFRLAKGTDEEKAARARAIQEATTLAAEVPLETMRACRDALRHAVIVAGNANRNAVSDVGVALELLLAGTKGAGLNVDINLGGLDDARGADRLRWERQDVERSAAEEAARARALL
jgi:formiminotetrahydrofolate cyclodeaminase